MGSPTKPKKRLIRSGFLLASQPGYRNDEPFRHNFTMRFPLHQQRALHVLAELLHYKEDLLDEHFPLFRGSHNLAELRAAALDLLSIARSLAEVAACWDEETSKRELLASAAADRFAVKLARLAREIEAAMDEIAPPRRAANEGLREGKIE
jgi:hypothetical protein